MTNTTVLNLPSVPDDDVVDALVYAWDWLSIEGKRVPGNLDETVKAAAKEFEHSFSFKLMLTSGTEFKAWQTLCDRHVSSAILGAFSERAGILYRGGQAVGTTRPGPRDNRLRRFVRRAGLLVEVRARGRSGKRGLEAAADV